MKRVSIFLLSLMIAGAQLYGKSWKMTYNSHGLIADEINKMNLTKYMDPGEPGINQVWDFSGLVVTTDFSGTIENSVFNNNYAEVQNTNVVLKEFSNEFYFKGDKKSLELYGVAINGKMHMKYDKPFVKMRYPFSYGDSFNGNYYGEYYSGKLKGTVDGDYSVVADGYGSVLLPNNVRIDNVLRVTETRSYTSTINNSESEVKHTTSRFYVQHYRFPLVVLIKNEFTANNSNTSVSYQAAYNDKIENLMIPTAISDVTIDVKAVNLFPNPVIEVLNIEYYMGKEGKMIIELFDVTGEMVYKILDGNQPAGLNTLRFNVKDKDIPAGNYYLKFNNGVEQNVKKIIIK